MARNPIDIGTIGNDGTGDSIRDAFRKVNDNFKELYSSLGLGDRLTFTGLEETPDSYTGQEHAIVTVNPTGNGLSFRKLQGGPGVEIDVTSSNSAISINSLFSGIEGDSSPNLGGPLNAQGGSTRWPIGNLPDLTSSIEVAAIKTAMNNIHSASAAVPSRFAVNKGYADTKIALSGIDSIDVGTGARDTSFGEMTGPLVLSRDPLPEDDAIWDGKTAATKRYVDNAGFASTANLYVAKSGADDRPNIGKLQQGRGLSYAYKTLEAALKRAEELVLESPIEIGPYKKVLTYNAGAGTCTLEKIGEATNSGAGLVTQLYMSVDTISVNSGGSLYSIGDIVTITGGTFSQAASFEVLSVNVIPESNGRGSIQSIRIITSGVYTVLPGNTNISTSSSGIGTNATVNLTFNVNNVQVTNGGTNYGLVSVRITGGGGSGAFGRAEVVNNIVVSITVTNRGSGFTSLPTVIVNLPRFFIQTDGYRTDFTGNVLSSIPSAIRTRDIREGLLLRGETSGALAQILAHSGELSVESDTVGCEIFDVDLLSGAFEDGEVIAYGDITKPIQISIFVESGIYEENYPLRIPQNVAIIGDEFRRTIIRPRPAQHGAPLSGMSSSPWAFLHFRRNSEFDGLTVTNQLFGNHYLTDSSVPVYPLINNKGSYRSAAQLLEINREFIKSQVIGWIANRVTTETSPFTAEFSYNAELCQRDVGLIIDAIVFDLKYGGYNRTISAALKYFSSVSSLLAITSQLLQTTAAMERINTLAQSVISNTSVTPLYTESGVITSSPLVSQILEQAYVAETGSGILITSLFDAIIDIISNTGAANYPKDNNQLDVFLCNDATIIRAMTIQGHGGFMMVLDPEGQIRTKSPYAQEAAGFSKSTGRKTFAGGMFVDGFTGNQQFKIVSAPTSTLLNVSGLLRIPQTPCSFIIDDTIFRVNYVRNYVNGIVSPTYSTAQLILDETTPYAGNTGTQTCTFSGSPGVLIISTTSENNLQPGATVRFAGGVLPTGLSENTDYFVLSLDFTEFAFKITTEYGSTTPVSISSAGSGTHTVERIFEILMPGNRSMLSNDFTQVNDLGYGLVVSNGGLTEAVSMFTYYCHISYYALSGGQIRSLGGSSSHGNYGLVAEGSDPLEVPTPVTLYHNLAQSLTIISDTSDRKNLKNGVVVYATYDDYLPLIGSELEVNHGNVLTRYLISAIDAITDITYPKLCKLSISSSAGLAAGIPHGQQVTIRQNSFVVLTGDIVDVATRPSTALRLNESNAVYRILNFDNYDSTFDKDIFTISSISGNVITTSTLHRQKVGYQVKIVKADSDTLPATINPKTSILDGTVYYIVESTDYTFKISTAKGGTPINFSAGPSYSGTLTSTVAPYGLALTQLRENYDHIDINIYSSQPYITPLSLTSCTVSATSPAIISAASHGFAIGTQIKFSGTLPTGISSGYYWIATESYGSNSFKISSTPPVYSTQIGVNGTLTAGSTTTITGLITTSGISVGSKLVAPANLSIGSITGSGTVATITFASSNIQRPPYLPGQTVAISGFTSPYAGFNNGTAVVLSCSTTTLTYANTTVGTTTLTGTVAVVVTGSLGTSPTIVSIDSETSITISSSGPSTGTVVFDVEGATVNASSTGSSVSFGKVIGGKGSTQIAISNLSSIDKLRIINTKLVHAGTEYVVTNYNENPSNAPYSVITLNKPIVISIVSYPNPIVLKSAVPAGTTNSAGTLTIRIALVRATSHDFLEVGTGGYADTNYPNDIFGPAVNDFNTVPAWATDYDTDGAKVSRAQVQERDVGRAFFVTTDQYGNFSVGPYFKVDQGTGTVTFSASIALSQLDGLGFKRGATIAEFSIDETMSDSATDSVPTESAVRGYIDRRLGFTHTGNTVISSSLIPVGNAGGVMALSGQLAMKGVMDLGSNRIINVATPTLSSDAARLDSINISNLKDVDNTNLFTFTEVQAGQLLALTGAKNTIGNFTPTGDVLFDIQSGDSTSNVIRTSIATGVIVNTDVNNAAAIVQSKLLLNAATVRDNATGIAQADLGVISVDSSQFTSTSGWATIKDNGISLSKLFQVPTKTVVGNSSLITGNVSAIGFSTVVADGGAIKKSQYTNVGYIKRINSISNTEDGNYEIVADDSASTSNTLVRRDSNKDFAGNAVTVNTIKLATSAPATSISYLTLDSLSITSLSGATQLYGYGGSGSSSFVGIAIGSGSVAADKKSYYNNETHLFRNQVGGTTFATLDATGLNIGDRTLTTTKITTGSSTTAGTITGQWILADTPGGSSRTNSRLQSTYAADLAEFYEGDKEYEVGTVLIFGGDKEVTISTNYADSRVAGVVSDNAAYSMYGACPGFKNQIALQGRVPCKVIGIIEKGTILVTSNIPGVATAVLNNATAGTIIGKALENYNSQEVGIIEVAVGRT